MPPPPKKWKGKCVDAGKDFNSSLCNNKLIGAYVFDRGYKVRMRGKHRVELSDRGIMLAMEHTRQPPLPVGSCLMPSSTAMPRAPQVAWLPKRTWRFTRCEKW
ncbi:hypothetical protein AMTR_s00069p00178620 [Amborella trichopoda]|uniref:Uncharacterized protein n=1 Tax=Amborella trichopoda TaxID=13333 RepID=U5DDD5_AMBTC|nr:hypothetical protein AMTR_s00069p00178620 [Amborella trichopoda]